MPVYEFQGVNRKGKAVKGTREADSEKLLRQLLKKEGIFLTSINAGKESGSLLSKEIDFGELLERITPSDIAIFTRQLK